MAKNAGADEAWATATQSRDVEFNFRDGSLEKVKDTTSRGLNIEVYADGRYSSHQTTDLNPDRLKSFVSEAVAITRALEPDEFRRITPPELFANRPSDDLDLVDASVAELSREQRLEWCRTLDRIATDHDKVISATAGVYDGSSQALIAGMARASRSRMRVTAVPRIATTRVASTSARCRPRATLPGSRLIVHWLGSGRKRVRRQRPRW